MDVSVFPPAIVGKLLLGQQGQQLVYEFCLRRGLHHLNGVVVQLPHGLFPLSAEVAPAENLKHAVPHMGKPQIGNGVDLRLGQVHFEIIFHNFSRLTRNWAQSPVNSPVRMLMTIITGR